jgi:diguanylate cyclase (GGDEF)-like protein
VAHEDGLAELLSDFARTVITDFPIQGILDHLVERIVEVLPITAAGVTLISPGGDAHYVAASNGSALDYERLQSELSEGPCERAYETGQAVSVPDLAKEKPLRAVHPEGARGGLVAVFAFPLNHGDKRLGALDLYRDTAGPLEDRDMRVAQTLADVAAAYVLNARSRDEALRASQRFQHRSLHDPLTGLPNRLALLERLEHAAQRARRSHTRTAVLYADLDDFKRVNDTHGHQVGDELLIAVAERLLTLLRAGDTLVRLGGDEFVLLCEDMSSPSDVDIVLKRLGTAFLRPFRFGGVEATITASVGVAYAGPGEEISNELLIRADHAMYEAKRNGGDSGIIDLRAAIEETGTHTLEQDLRSALAALSLDVAYQPIVRTVDGLVTGVEALLRWNDPQRGAVPAALMVAAAEGSDLIVDIGAWVLERSCTDRLRWLRDNPAATLDLAVNVSARQLLSAGFTSTVERVLDTSGMDPGALTLELTETIFINDDRAMAVLGRLSSMGVRLALDDFGTGYAALSYLSRVPVDIVKIDRRFVTDLDSAPKGGAIMSAVADLAHVLGFAVTAEGIETRQQSEQVSALGCESSQGYYFARPMSSEAIGGLLETTTGPLHLPHG